MLGAMKTDIALLLLRVPFGAFMILGHGYPKLQRFSEMSTSFPDPLGIGSLPSFLLTLFAEVVCALAILFGFFTRWAAIPLAICMAVAAFIVHAADPFKGRELALVYLIGYVVIYLLGPGRFSVDRSMGRA